MRRKDRPGIFKRRPLRSFLRERSTLIIERPLLGSRKASVEEKAVEEKRSRSGRIEPSKGFVEYPKPKEHSHLSFEGQSKLSYCLECFLKHSQTAKVLMREAVQRAHAGGPSTPGVMEKVRGVVEELCGFEDDSTTVENENVSTLNSLSRSLRKFIYMKEAEIGGASLGDLHEIKDMIDKLVDASYQVRANEECIGCTVESVCAANVECVDFVEKAIKGVKDSDQIRKILREARDKYGRG